MKSSPYQRIVRAAERGTGLRLSAEDAQTLADDASIRAAALRGSGPPSPAEPRVPPLAAALGLTWWVADDGRRRVANAGTVARALAERVHDAPGVRRSDGSLVEPSDVLEAADGPASGWRSATAPLLGALGVDRRTQLYTDIVARVADASEREADRRILELAGVDAGG